MDYSESRWRSPLPRAGEMMATTTLELRSISSRLAAQNRIRVSNKKMALIFQNPPNTFSGGVWTP